MEPNQKYYELDGTEHTFRQVALDYLVYELESLIRREVPDDRRADVYRKVLVGCPGYTERPEWDKEPLNPNGEPLTSFSVCVMANTLVPFVGHNCSVCSRVLTHLVAAEPCDVQPRTARCFCQGWKTKSGDGVSYQTTDHLGGWVCRPQKALFYEFW